ncbi:MAG TPA: hypothetical protein VMW52_11120, partial [Phycisphaerae bacterium]|nr:hypothetical protein [Phycisphaerae bacterium]
MNRHERGAVDGGASPRNRVAISRREFWHRGIHYRVLGFTAHIDNDGPVIVDAYSHVVELL